MSAAQNASYAVAQLAHNFGSVAVVGGSIAALLLMNAEVRKKMAWLVLVGWGLQAISGAFFGLISYTFDQQFPDISGIAKVSLLTKMICTATGFILLLIYILRDKRWAEGERDRVWFSSSALAVVAMSSAAILRWFS